MRHRQSSVTTDTQFPVRSIGAAARGVGGAASPPRTLRTPRTLRAERKKPVRFNLRVLRVLRGRDISLPSTAQIPKSGFDEHRCRPGSGRRTVSTVVLERRSGRLDLLERHPLLDQVLNTIADDGENVTVLDHI